jgi:small subunit ribosomal protein S16
MPVKIRLTRMGKKKQPSYRVVVMDSRKPRDGKYIEQIGRYDPREDPSLIEINNSRAVEWLKQGAQPTDRAKKLLEISGAWTEFKVARGEIHTVDETSYESPVASRQSPVDVAPVMLDEIQEQVEEAEEAEEAEEVVEAVEAAEAIEVVEAVEAVDAVEAAADDTIEITTVEDTNATETDEA